MKNVITATKIVLFASLIVCTIGCNNDDDATPVDDSGRVVLADDGNLGQIMTDGNGQVLYFFTLDADGNSACYEGCLGAWPVYYAEDLAVGEGLDEADFGTITRDDGDMQSTYKGWPLYYYSPTGDGVLEGRGETSGEGVNNVWYVAKESYDLMIADGQLVGADGVNYKSDYTEGEEMTKYFTDAEGRTLYIFVNDSRDTNNYTNEDFSNNPTWPIFHVEISDLPAFMNTADFGEIDVHGQMQLTYRGWPVYYFGGDTQRGDTKGVSVPVPGVWPIINGETPEAQ